METKIYKANSDGIKSCGEILKNGGIVAIPTETVYGLAANGLDGNAVAKIFKAKGRPMDNPLILHISDISELDKLVSEIPQSAKLLAERFWGGPLTMIMKKSNIIPNEVSAGLDTVAIRLPSNEIAKQVIESAGVPLAAPSANLSGSPSPTNAKHCIDDLMGKVDAILDGGECGVGVESTVITLVTSPPKLLRPGAITAEMLIDVLGEIEIDDAVTHQLKEGETAASPGMKYKHYAPKTNVIIVKGDAQNYCNYVNSQQGNVLALCFSEDEKMITKKTLSYGSINDDLSQANSLFNALREVDQMDVTTVYAHCPKKTGVGLAVYNRLIRAAAFQIIEL